MLRCKFLLSLLFVLFSVSFFAQKDDINKIFIEAVKTGNIQNVEIFLNKGADINYVDSIGFSALHYAAGLDLKEIVTLLIIKGCKINILAKGGSTPLMNAAYYGNIHICYILYKHNASFEIIDKDGNTCKDYAKKAGFLRVEKFLDNPKTYSNELTYYECFDSTYFYFREKNKKQTILFADKTQQIIKNELLSTHPDYISIINDLANIYYNFESFSKSELLYLQILEIYKKSAVKESKIYMTTLNNLGRLYFSVGNFSKSELYLNQLIEIRNNQEFAKDLEYAINLSDLATTYNSQGKSYRADSLFLEAIKIMKFLGKNNKDYANTLNNYAMLNYNLGNYSKAEYLYLSAISIEKEISGLKSLKYAIYLNNLALLYWEMKNYSKAKPLYYEVLQIRKEKLGENDLDYINSLDNIAALLYSMCDYSKAELLYQDILKKKQSLNGENTYDYAASLNNLAALYEKIGNSTKAEELYFQALKIWEQSLGINHPFYARGLINIAALLQCQEKYKEGEFYFVNSWRIEKKNIQNNFKFQSEKERKFYWETKKLLFNNRFNAFAYSYHPQKPSISTFAYDNTLFIKGLLLNTSLQIQNAVLQSGDTVLINTWNNLRDLKRQLNILQSKPLAQQGDLPIMEAQADSLDKVLTQMSQLYKQSTADMQVKWSDVQKNLKPDEAAIEFFSFNYFNKHYTDSIMYCALVLKKDSKYPEMIPLFDEKQLDSLFVKSSSDVNQLYTYRVTNLRKDTAERILNYGSKLYNLLWKQLEASLKNMKTVYYAPSGKLNQVAFAAIPVDSTLLLSDKYNLHQVTSTRQVIKKNDAPAKVHDAALFGGIQYELDNKQLAQVQTTTNTGYRSAFVSDSTQRSTNFVYLKGTGEEVTGIAEEFKKKGLTDQLFTGTVASEAAFKKLSGTNTDIIHIATHGFYLPIEKTKQEDFRFMGLDNERRNVVYHNPLLRSGLVFAGANRAWRGDTIPDNWEDGILTAHEISQINLTNTELVVLSACETGLGDNGGSEGVFGLQRAFKMAGVQTLIMSLWKVPDTQTSQLMQGFYKYWLGGMTKHDAFKEAQNEVRATNPNPYYWAAFVMVD